MIRADGAGAEGRRTGVAGGHQRIGGIDTEGRGDDMRDGGLVALPARRIAASTGAGGGSLALPHHQRDLTDQVSYN